MLDPVKEITPQTADAYIEKIIKETRRGIGARYQVVWKRDVGKEFSGDHLPGAKLKGSEVLKAWLTLDKKAT